MDFETLKVLRQIAVARVKSSGLWYQVTTNNPLPLFAGIISYMYNVLMGITVVL